MAKITHCYKKYLFRTVAAVLLFLANVHISRFRSAETILRQENKLTQGQLEHLQQSRSLNAVEANRHSLRHRHPKNEVTENSNPISNQATMHPQHDKITEGSNITHSVRPLIKNGTNHRIDPAMHEQQNPHHWQVTTSAPMKASLERDSKSISGENSHSTPEPKPEETKYDLKPDPQPEVATDDLKLKPNPEETNHDSKPDSKAKDMNDETMQVATDSTAEKKAEEVDSPENEPTKAETAKMGSIEDSVSACVMVMDANHELIEWLAYHYHTLPLRRLIVWNDPKSKTTPEPILRRWDGLMEISLWNETRVFPKGYKQKETPHDTYIFRQEVFTKTCMQALQQEGHRWVAIMDPDEYITINDRVYNNNDTMHNVGVDENLAKQENLVAPSMEEPGAMLRFMKAGIAHVHRYGTQGNLYMQSFETPCLPFHRRFYGTFESNHTNSTITASLKTFRWRYWGRPNEKIPEIGKVIVDMKRLNVRDGITGNVHIPLLDEGLCRRKILYSWEHSMPLVMNHYSGTREQYLFRSNDSRGGVKERLARYEREKTYKVHHDTAGNIRQWLSGFVKSVGDQEAGRLLKHAGEPQLANIGAYLVSNYTIRGDKLATTVIPKSSSQPEMIEDSVSACVMVMDANHELIEWLAYHYHTLPLRRLIVMNDPKSKTSPEPILHRWDNLMNISVWNETHMPFTRKKKYNGHQAYQDKFVETCMKELRDNGHRWIVLMDPDEYITINDRVYDTSDPMYNLGIKNVVPPSMQEPGAVLNFIKAAIAHVHRYGTQGNPFLESFETPCLQFHRKSYGNLESQDNTTLGAPTLRTFRWRHWGNRKSEIGKSLVDMKRIYKNDALRASVHQPIADRRICRWKFAFGKERLMPLVMNHYSGTLEQFLFRSQDSRGGVEKRVARYKQEQANKAKFDAVGNILQWLPGFERAVGSEEAFRLLKDAEKPYDANIGAYVEPSQEMTQEEYDRRLLTQLREASQTSTSSIP